MAKTLLDYRGAQAHYWSATEKGVAVIVKHPHAQKIYMFEECRTKRYLGKIAGMKSCVLETAKKGESLEKTQWRAMEEEAPGMNYVFERAQGYYQVVDGIWVAAFVVRSSDTRLPVFPRTADPEIKSPRWVCPHEALQTLWLRRGVAEIIRDYMAGQSKICCMDCNPPDPKP